MRVPDAYTKKHRWFKSQLTRLQNKKDYEGIITLDREFVDWANHNGWPDDWMRWSRAREDAEFSLLDSTW